MALRELQAEDLWNIIVGSTVLATGGGGIAPSRELFEHFTRSTFESGLKPAMVDAEDLADDEMVYRRTGAGGMVRREDKEKWLINPGLEARWRPDSGFDQRKWIKERLRELEYLYPIPAWSSRPDETWSADVAERRLQELIGKPPAAYIASEVGPNLLQKFLKAAQEGKPLVDADTAGYRAVPENSLCSLAVHEAPITPVVLATPWGDLIVYEKVLNWQRLEDLNRQIAVSCGGEVHGWMAHEGRVIKSAAVAGSLSKARAIGEALKQASESQRDPVQAVAEAAGGHILFRGTVRAQVNEDKGGFIWGDIYLEGIDRFQGQFFRIWYKNENHMSWLDNRPFVMSPDLITVVDGKSGVGLSNFAVKEWQWGREVAVLGIPCAPVWRSEMGLRIFHPWRWGFALEYVPIEQRLAEFGLA
ncbi:MAG: DUF917 domain-containing protein [Ardenticatenaceae bacterium]|nr:DUF917 domain-containing protein [Ardenticatenaceae bacterium]